MPITSVTKDPAALTMTVVAEFPVPVARLWDAYADPRQLEKFWGPVEWPATFTRHDFATGGRSEYYMTGPDGERSAGHWKYLAVNPGTSFEVEDGFSNEDGSDNEDMPSMRMVFTFEPTATGSRVATTTHFPSAEALEQLLGMGMEEGMTSAMSQMDAVIEDLRSYAVGIATNAQILNDHQIRVTRIIRGTPEQVWAAHHEPEIAKRWLFGPDGWALTEYVVAQREGDRFRQWWKPLDPASAPAEMADGFGFDGELLESVPGVREVTTEHMIDTDYQALNELTLTPVEGGTLLSLVITYANSKERDEALATGMTDGMEAGYKRLENEVLA